MLELIAEVKAQGLPEQRACQVLGINPRSLQRWRRPVPPTALAPACQPPRPHNALLREEAAAVVTALPDPFAGARRPELPRTGVEPGKQA